MGTLYLPGCGDADAEEKGRGGGKVEGRGLIAREAQFLNSVRTRKGGSFALRLRLLAVSDSMDSCWQSLTVPQHRKGKNSKNLT